MLTTGASDNNRAYNIYDVAGNVFEYTHEIAWLHDAATTEQYRSVRGGSYHYTGDYCPAYFRQTIWANDFTRHDIGFRVMLYMK